MICFSTQMPFMAKLKRPLYLYFGYLTVLFELLNVMRGGKMNYH